MFNNSYSSDLIQLFINDNLNTASIDQFTYNAIKSKNLVYPLYNKIVLASVRNTFHLQALNFKSQVIKGYSFTEEKKAGKIPDFLKNNVVDFFDNPISFDKYIETQLYNEAIYYEFNDVVHFLGKNVEKLMSLSPKYVYPNKDKTELYYILPDANFSEFLQNEPGSKENNIDYSKNMQRLTKFDTFNNGGSDIRFFQFTGKGSESDYFPDIPYLQALESMQVNKFIGNYDLNWLKNGTNFRSILELNGLSTKNTADKEIIEKYERDFNNNLNNGKTYVIGNPFPERSMSFSGQPQSQKEDFGEVRDKNRDEILAAHGLNPTLLGIKTNESSLTSTSIGETIKQYVETQLSNKVVLLEQHFNRLFRVIDPAYNTEVKLKMLSFEDLLKQTQIKNIQLQNEEKFIARGNYEDFNLYRKFTGQRELKEDEFNKMVQMVNNFGMDFIQGFTDVN